jgi:spore germination protein KB
MSGSKNLTTQQFTLLVIFFTLGTTILNIPSGLAADAKQDGWLAAAFGTMISLLFVWFYNKLGLLFPNLNYIQLNEKLLGKWIGKVTSAIYLSAMLIASADLMFYVGNFMTTAFMPRTPIQAINILFVILIIMGIRLGIETIARTAEILFPWYAVLLISLIVLIAPQIKFDNLQPILEFGIKPILKASIPFIATSALPLVALLMIFPAHLNNKKKAQKSFLFGNFAGGIVMICVTLICISVLGAFETSQKLYSTFELARKISVGHFLERLEALMAALWVISIYFKLTIYFYSFTVGLAEMLKLKNYRPLTLPLGMILVVLSLMVYPNVPYQQEWDKNNWIPYITLVGFLIPLLLFLVGVFRKKRGAAKG